MAEPRFSGLGWLAPIGARRSLSRFLDVELEFLSRLLNTEV